MKTIVCNINLFDAHQKVDLYNDEGRFEQTLGYATLEKLSAIMMIACEQYKSNHIRLIGNEQFLSKIAEDTRRDFNQKYGKNDIKIEVN